jgi:hypothetical protein
MQVKPAEGQDGAKRKSPLIRDGTGYLLTLLLCFFSAAVQVVRWHVTTQLH